MSGNPSVSIVIPAARAADDLRTCLSRVGEQDYENIVDIVVAAADRASAIAAAQEGARVVDNPSGKTASGLNLAVAASSGDVIVRVDAHSEIPMDYVSRIIETFNTSRAECVGGMQIPVGKTFWERSIAAAMTSRLGSGGADYRTGDKAGPTDTVYLGAYRRPTLEDLGGYDESFFRNQDYELNHRLRKAGGTVWFEPSIRVAYRPRASLAALWSQYYDYGTWKRYFSRHHGGRLRLRQYVPPVFVGVLVLSLAASFFSSWALLVPFGYVAAVLIGSIANIRRAGNAAIGMPASLGTMHLAWGLGFLVGQTSDR